MDLWDKRSIVIHFSLMNVRVKYKGTFLGLVWAAVEPLLFFIVLYVVFSSIRQTTHENYGIYLISGLILYHLFSKGTLNGLSSLRNNAGILKSLNITREFFPVVATGTIVILTFVELGVFLGLMPFFEFVPNWTLILFPIVILLLLVLILGVSYILSVAYVYSRDIQFFWTIFVYALLFVSPVFWVVEDVDGVLLEIQKINPIGQIIELGHKVVFGSVPSINEWLTTAGYVFGILFVGYFIFKKFEKKLVEEL